MVHSDDISFVSRRGKYKNHKGEGDGILSIEISVFVPKIRVRGSKWPLAFRSFLLLMMSKDLYIRKP